MAGEWTPTTLARVLSFSNGKSSPERADNLSYPVYGSNGIIGYADETSADPETIVIGRVGSYCGSLYFSKQKCWVTDNAIRANALDDNDAKFLFYLLQTLDLNHWRAGSGQPLLNQTILGSIPASIPQPPEQRAIAHILGTLDDKIELNRRMNETLEAMARALFKSWFVDFDPVRAKAEGRDPGLPKAIADLFPDSFEDSELGEIPKGWEVKSFTEIVEVIGGGTPKTSVEEYWGGDIPWYSVVDAPSEADVFVVSTEKTITNHGLNNSSARLLPEGTTIISARGTVGKLALTGVPMAMNQSCYGLRGIDAGPAFTYFATRSLVSMLKQRSHGSVFDTITRDTLAGMRFISPDKSILDAFERAEDPFMRRIKSNLLESRVLGELRDSLLPKLVSGEIRVQNRESHLEATA